MSLCQSPGYCLSVSRYRNTSVILQVLTREYGVVHGVIKGVYSKQKPSMALRDALQMGFLIECTWRDRSGLKNMYNLQLIEPARPANAQVFVSLAYVNELLKTILAPESSEPKIFYDYARFVSLLPTLKHCTTLAKALRDFELDFLKALGIGIDWLWDATYQRSVVSQAYYVFDPEHGMVCAAGAHVPNALQGLQLQAIAAGEYENAPLAGAVKRCTRLMIANQLGGRELKARSVFRSMFDSSTSFVNPVSCPQK